eukprot:TRINITY_DN10457_c0_g2_i3.p4 TRINITY_DN10457_c0_g2~~TRINITY_DN10457_c0_g2_i3.p4  ORF type:complete len:226 (-),score=55.36 TRINITY_DN10457_c0_g2_i3:2014-2691(-)
MARYMRVGVKIKDQTHDMIQLGGAAQRIKELRTQEENKRKQITIRKTGVRGEIEKEEKRDKERTELEENVKGNTKAIGEIWSAVATLSQAQNEHWQYSRMQGDVTNLVQLKSHLEREITEVKSKIRMMELEKRMAKIEGEGEKGDMKEKLNKQKEKWKKLLVELGEVEEKMMDSRQQMDAIHLRSMDRIIQWGKGGTARTQQNDNLRQIGMGMEEEGMSKIRGRN